MEIVTDKVRTARKSHRCEMCGREITKATQYHYQFLVDGGDKWSICECMDCHKAIQLVYDKENIRNSDEATYGDFYDIMEQALFDRGKLSKEFTKVHEVVTAYLNLY